MKIKPLIAIVLLTLTVPAHARSGGWFVELMKNSEVHTTVYYNNCREYRPIPLPPPPQPRYQYTEIHRPGPAPYGLTSRGNRLVEDYGSYHVITYQSGPYR